MRPAKVLIVKTADGKDLQTNFRRKKRGYQKNRPPASETMTTFQKANRNKAKKQKNTDSVVRRAAQIAAKRAARGDTIGSRLRAEREVAGKQRAYQLELEHRAESDDQEAIQELMQLKTDGKFIKITGGFQNKELRQTAMGKKVVVEANSIPKFQAARSEGETKTSKPPTPPEMSSPIHKAPSKTAERQASTPEDPKPHMKRPQPQRTQQQLAAAQAAERRTIQQSQKTSKTTQPDRLRKEVTASRGAERPQLPKRRERVSRTETAASAARRTEAVARRAERQVEKPALATKSPPPVSREERARQADKRHKDNGARRIANERVKERMRKAEQSKENLSVSAVSKGQVKWSAAPDRGGTKRGQPYGGSGLSDASRKYREKKAQGTGCGNDMNAASAVYKARIRMKEAKKKKRTALAPSYAAPGSMAHNAMKAEENAKGKAAFGSGAGSISDELNEVVFGKGSKKAEKKIYTADGKTKSIATKRKLGDKKADPRKSRGGPSPRGSPPATRQNSTNNVDMGRGGKKLGGSVVAARAMDPREARLAALKKRGLE